MVASNPIFPQIAQIKRLQWAGIDSRRFTLFTHIENMNFVKPRRLYYGRICSLINVPADRCIMIGNDPVNDMVAGEIGMRTFLTTEAGQIDYASLALTGLRTKPLPVPEQMLHLDLWVMLAAALLMGPFLFRAIPIGKRIGAALLAGYAAYVAVLL